MFDYVKNHLQYALRSYLRNPNHIAKNVIWRWRSGVSSKRHVFVIGAPRSGTTLLQTLIAGHSRYCTWEGETTMFTWRDTFSTTDNHLGLNEDVIETHFRRQNNLVDFFDACVGEFLEGRSADRFVEKTPQHVKHTQFLTHHFPKSHIVHIYRDGRDCYCSARKAEIPRGGDLGRFARYWRTCIEARRSASSGQIIDVSYETLTAQPEDTMHRLMAALGDELESGQLDPSRRAEDQRADVQKFRKLGQSINTSSQGRWKGELSQKEVQRFEQIAGEQLRAFGYQTKPAA